MTLSKHRTFRTLFTIMQDMPWFRAKPVVQSLRQKRSSGISGSSSKRLWMSHSLIAQSRSTAEV